MLNNLSLAHLQGSGKSLALLRCMQIITYIPYMFYQLHEPCWACSGQINTLPTNTIIVWLTTWLSAQPALLINNINPFMPGVAKNILTIFMITFWPELYLENIWKRNIDQNQTNNWLHQMFCKFMLDFKKMFCKFMLDFNKCFANSCLISTNVLQIHAWFQKNVLQINAWFQFHLQKYQNSRWHFLRRTLGMRQNDQLGFLAKALDKCYFPSAWLYTTNSDKS